MLLDLILLLTLFVASVGTYFSIWENEQVKIMLAGRNTNHTGAIIFYSYQKVLGGFLFGVIPYLVYSFIHHPSFSDIGLQISLSNTQWGVVIGLSLIPFITGLKSANNEDHLKIYPQLRIKTWGIPLYLFNLLVWGIYLAAYEFLFRGLLFFPLFEYMELWQVFAINTLLYSLAHVPKGRKETLAAIPFGLILCWVTHYTQSVFPAFLIHLTAAFSNDIYSVLFWKKHPDIH